MKKSFFQKSYNLSINLLLYGLILFLLSILLNLVNLLLAEINVLSLKDSIMFIQDKLKIAEKAFYFVGLFIMISSSTLITSELIQRTLNDSIWNYFKSIYQTIHLRKFLRQEEQSETLSSNDGAPEIKRYNPIIKCFNQTVSKCIVDVRRDSIAVYIRYPKSQQAQKLLRDMEEHIKEEISNRNPNYYFSAPNRVGSKLLFTGTRR